MSYENFPLVSVVIPIYNTEKYLEQCVSSILCQSYQNLEIILVDDASPDNCSAICDSYAVTDARIRVIHKENGGASSARKAGIAAMTGEYLMFVDSDDWIEPDTIELCMRAAQTHRSDCVLFSYIREYFDRSVPNFLFESDFFYTAKEAEERIHRRLIGLTAHELKHPERIDNLSPVWMKLYRKDAARRGHIVSEREVGTSEDTLFNLYALDGCSVAYINKCLYHYRKTNSNSITKRYKANLPEKWDTLYRHFEEYIDSSDRSHQYRTPFLNRVACGMIGLGLNEISAPTSLLMRAKRIRQILRRPLYQQAFSQLDYGACPFYWKVFFFLCKYRCALLLTLLLMVISCLRSKKFE